VGRLRTFLSLPILDGGPRKSELAGAKSRHSGEVTADRRQILVVFREVKERDAQFLGLYSLIVGSIRPLDRVMHPTVAPRVGPCHR